PPRARRCRTVRSRGKACAWRAPSWLRRSGTRPIVAAERDAVPAFEVLRRGDLVEAGGLQQRAHRGALRDAVLEQQPAARGEAARRIAGDGADRVEAVRAR